MNPKRTGKGGHGQSGREEAPYSHVISQPSQQAAGQQQSNRPPQFYRFPKNGDPRQLHPGTPGSQQLQGNNHWGGVDDASAPVHLPQKRQRTAEAQQDMASSRPPVSSGALDAGSLKEYFSLPIQEAAKKMGVSVSAINT